MPGKKKSKGPRFGGLGSGVGGLGSGVGCQGSRVSVSDLKEYTRDRGRGVSRNPKPIITFSAKYAKSSPPIVPLTS
jgi:hypothetical protein